MRFCDLCGYPIELTRGADGWRHEMPQGRSYMQHEKEYPECFGKPVAEVAAPLPEPENDHSLEICRYCRCSREAHPNNGPCTACTCDGWDTNQMEAGEWVQPIETGYTLACCDCGLVHSMDFRIHEGKIQFRAFRADEIVAPCGAPDSPEEIATGKYEPFNAAGTMCPPDPEMVDEQIRIDAEEVSLPPSDPTVDDMEAGLELAHRTPGCYLKTQGDCNFAARFAERERQLLDALRELRRYPAKWWEDSSLETWFPLTAEELKRTKDEVARLKEDLSRGLNVEFQRTTCAICGVYKHTPVRNDDLGGYVCGGCLEKAYEESQAELAKLNGSSGGEKDDSRIKIYWTALDDIAYGKQHSGVIPCPQDYGFYIKPWRDIAQKALDDAEELVRDNECR